jgi:hypothetical protein
MAITQRLLEFLNSHLRLLLLLTFALVPGSSLLRWSLMAQPLLKAHSMLIADTRNLPSNYKRSVLMLRELTNQLFQ